MASLLMYESLIVSHFVSHSHDPILPCALVPSSALEAFFVQLDMSLLHLCSDFPGLIMALIADWSPLCWGDGLCCLSVCPFSLPTLLGTCSSCRVVCECMVSSHGHTVSPNTPQGPSLPPLRTRCDVAGVVCHSGAQWGCVVCAPNTHPGSQLCC